MGKKITYTVKPKNPRAAKVAWAYIEETHGAPKSLWFDHETGEWVAVYEDKALRISTEVIS